MNFVSFPLILTIILPFPHCFLLLSTSFNEKLRRDVMNCVINPEPGNPNFQRYLYRNPQRRWIRNGQRSIITRMVTWNPKNFRGGSCGQCYQKEKKRRKWKEKKERKVQSSVCKVWVIFLIPPLLMITDIVVHSFSEIIREEGRMYCSC